MKLPNLLAQPVQKITRYHLLFDILLLIGTFVRVENGILDNRGGKRTLLKATFADGGVSDLPFVEVIKKIGASNGRKRKSII